MPEAIVCRAQIEMELALKKGAIARLVAGAFTLATAGSDAPRIIIEGGASLHVVARESSTPHVEAWGSSTPHVEAWGSSTPHVVARESSTPHVEARESSTPHVEAWGYCHLTLRGKISAKCSANVTIVSRDSKSAVAGGRHQVVNVTTPAEWCEYFGVEVADGLALLYKGVNDQYFSGRGTCYAPGTMPSAPDWDGGMAECGGGLHFSPTPMMTHEFCSPQRYLACPVALADMSIHWDGQSPQKCKAKGLSAPAYEVDRYGKPISKRGSFRICADWYSADLFAKTPDARFIFGDNADRVGRGGQAAVCRDHPQAIGIATLWGSRGFFSDDDAGAGNVIAIDFAKAETLLKEGRDVYWPSTGIGTGVAELPTRAPRLFAYIESQRDRLAKAYP